MARATKEQVEHALRVADAVAQLPVFNPDDPLDALAAEVRALREELAWQVACCKALQESQAQLAATIARVEALERCQLAICDKHKEPL